MNKPLITFFVLSLAFASCAVQAADNQLTDQEKKDGWILLFNGKDYTGWQCNNGKEVASEVVDGSMQPYKSGGYIIIYKKQFGDFILKCDVKMPEQCNSGIFYRIEDPKNPVHTGFEIQVATGEGNYLPRLRRDLRSRSPQEERNQGPQCLELRGDQSPGAKDVREAQWANWSARWTPTNSTSPVNEPSRAITSTKLKGEKRAVKDFARKGYLGFQDHGHPVWYKNVKLLPLK